MSASVRSLRKRIKSDRRYKRLRQNFEELPQYRISFEGFGAELKLMQSQRSVSKLDPGDPQFLRSLIRATTHDQAMRSRATEILVLCSQAERSLDNTLRHMHDYLLSEYKDALHREFRTISERKQFISGALRRFSSYLADVQAFKEQIQLYVTDIDKAGYAVKNMVDAFATIRKAEGTVTV